MARRYLHAAVLFSLLFFLTSGLAAQSRDEQLSDSEMVQEARTDDLDAAVTDDADSAKNGDDATPAPELGWKLERGAKEVGFEFNFAPMQPTFLSGKKEYDTSGRKLVMTTMRFGRVIGTVKGVTYQYFFEASPLAFAIDNEVRHPDDQGRPEADRKPTYRQTTYAFAIHPAGFRFVFMPSRRLKPYVQTSTGFIFTRKPIPVPQSPNYNFSGDFGGGVMYSVNRRQTIQFGYKYFHISNMNIGEINPGYNANIFYAGYSFFYK